MRREALIILILGTISLFVSCSNTPEKMVMTVTGPIKASKMGITLSHEHVLVDFIGADSTGYHRWDREQVVERVTPYFKELKAWNVHTVVECTPAYVGRDPWILRTLARKTGIHLITNTGYYGAGDNLFLPRHFYEMNSMELSSLWIDEFRNGIEDSGVKPGFIKIAVGPSDTLSPDHEKIVAAAAMTHNKTGLVIASHTGPDNPAFAQIQILRTYGIDPSHFIWVHAQRGSLEGNLKAAGMGAWISLDNLNQSQFPDPEEQFSTSWYAERIQALKEAGYLNRVLLSHDAGWYSPGEEKGGDFRGYSDLFTALIPLLEERGFSQEDIDLLLLENPAEAFSVEGL